MRFLTASVNEVLLAAANHTEMVSVELTAGLLILQQGGQKPKNARTPCAYPAAFASNPPKRLIDKLFQFIGRNFW